jgi:catechol 2,3-dioxygenase-like lactoylglutathione lyase family enzyme
MISYVMYGTNDVARAVAFYEAVLGELGIIRTADLGARGATFGHSHNEGVHLGIGPPFNGERATYGNGTMVGLRAPDERAVDRVHARALALGGADEGAPGRRGTSGFYACYFRDPDGNKLCVFTMIEAL